MPLSPKLQIILENLIPAEDVWDFCCDHGYLGWAALESQKFEDVFFVDQVPHIIEKLEQKVVPLDFRKKAHFRAVPAQCLQEPVKGTVVIAGVGAYTAFEIIETLWKKDLLKARRLIVSPQRDDEKLSSWMHSLGEEFNHRYSLTNKQHVLEGRRALWVYICGQ